MQTLFWCLQNPHCAITCINISMQVKNPKHWQPCHCLDTAHTGRNGQCCSCSFCSLTHSCTGFNEAISYSNPILFFPSFINIPSPARFYPPAPSSVLLSYNCQWRGDWPLGWRATPPLGSAGQTTQRPAGSTRVARRHLSGSTSPPEGRCSVGTRQIDVQPADCHTQARQRGINTDYTASGTERQQ